MTPRRTQWILFQNNALDRKHSPGLLRDSRLSVCLSLSLSHLSLTHTRRCSFRVATQVCAALRTMLHGKEWACAQFRNEALPFSVFQGNVTLPLKPLFGALNISSVIWPSNTSGPDLVKPLFDLPL